MDTALIDVSWFLLRLTPHSNPPKSIKIYEYLTSPPVAVSSNRESSMARWLNDIAILIEKHVPNVREYTTMEGEHCTFSQRRWTAENAKMIRPPSSPYRLRCKLDMVLTNYVDDKTMLMQGKRTPYSNVLALCAMSTMPYRKNQVMPGSMEEKSYIMQMEQDDRCFTPAIGFVGDMFILCIFDRGGVQSFKIRLNNSNSPKKILHVLGCLFFG